jgi:hypothetical protein
MAESEGLFSEKVPEGRFSRAKEAAKKLGISGDIGEKHPLWAKARIDSAALAARLKSCPFKAGRFFAASKAWVASAAAMAVRAGALTYQSCPFRTMRFSAACLAALALPSQGQAGPVVQMDYSNPELSPPRWTLTLHPDGSGHFHSERGNPAAGSLESGDLPRLEAPSQERDIHVSAAFAERVFLAARNHKRFNEECESHMKVAFQGWKKLSYSGPDGQGSCEFNYSRDKEIQELGDSLAAVAETILEGAKLEKLLLHDRLGLDREMEYLIEASGDGRAQQIGVIREILERLAEDQGVMERVRKRARALLAKAE